MMIIGHFCLLLTICSVLDLYKRFLECFVWSFLMDCLSCLKLFTTLHSDVGCGFLVYVNFGQVLHVLSMFLVFGLGLRVLQLSCHSRGFTQSLFDFKLSSRHGLCSNHGFDGRCDSNVSSCECGSLKSLMNSNPPMTDTLEETKGSAKSDVDVDSGEEYDDADIDREGDVMALRKIIKMERHRADAACLEVEKERMAASTAAEEAMAMILHLQNEKSLIEMEARQYRRLAQEKQLHDQEVIESLRWIVMKHESERSVLEDQLSVCKRKLKLHIKRDEGDKPENVDDFSDFSNENVEENLYYDGLVSSLEIDLSR
ncbi:hypothetical protein RJ639_014325 [Escallonia herrerae]|uniref:GTD-binding domain-containing protein n=1 Tax=Escallonia herrerae TaxID=1293975 RepID=A0AA88VIB1_9ASTE|nr:hypothetical protein RJ639_014325 [Escallonia herrerae]